MGRESGETRCPWCGEVVPVAEVKVGRHKNDYGTVVERRCPKCSRVLAAYLDGEGDFLPKTRTF